LDLQARRDLNNGFGDSLAKAFELALTPLLFGFLGHLLDRWAGTSPLFLLGFALFTFGYLAWKSWGRYSEAMAEHERRLGIRPDRGRRA